jgi:hypothetical protein
VKKQPYKDGNWLMRVKKRQFAWALSSVPVDPSASGRSPHVWLGILVVENIDQPQGDLSANAPQELILVRLVVDYRVELTAKYL